MKEYVNNAEVETKASRETIMRLVSEAEKEQRNNSRYSVEMDGLRVVRQAASVEFSLATCCFIACSDSSSSTIHQMSIQLDKMSHPH